MHYWLLKTEPADYSADVLEREGRTHWDGVSNPVALKHLRSMSVGDGVMVYHTGDERAIVALAEVAGKPQADPRDRSGRLVSVEISFAKRLARPVSLAEIKADPAFGRFDLVRISRLSVMPVPQPLWERIIRRSEEPAPA